VHTLNQLGATIVRLFLSMGERVKPLKNFCVFTQ